MDLWDFVPGTWQSHLQSVRPHINLIGLKVQDMENRGIVVNPPREQVFASLQVAPEDVRVVILGQDPYPNSAHAMGLSFSVPAATQPLPPSLRNILTELIDDVGECSVSKGSLESWTGQGVLLLNRVLTVEAGKSDSHKTLGWQQVTDTILRAVVEVNPHVVAVLWGKQAQATRSFFNPVCVIESVHPSPLSAYRGFLGSRPFTAVNRLLAEHKQGEIQW